jgi:hypothetical protein
MRVIACTDLELRIISQSNDTLANAYSCESELKLRIKEKLTRLTRRRGGGGSTDAVLQLIQMPNIAFR